MSSTTSSTSKAATLAQLQAVIDGLQSQLPNAQFTLGNTTFTTATLVQALQSLVAAIRAANAAQASAEVAVAAMHEAAAKFGPVFLAIKRTLVTMYGNATDKLALFGLKPRKAPAPLTADQLAARKAKANATRAARGTTSAKQKKSIKGNVTGVNLTPVTAPTDAPPTAAPPAPAAPAASPTGPAKQ
jgi:hypothetical protein